MDGSLYLNSILVFGESEDSENLTVKLRLASVCYTHSPHFLQELKSCATEFKHYMAVVASSLKHAATEMAMGLVSKRWGVTTVQYCAVQIRWNNLAIFVLLNKQLFILVQLVICLSSSKSIYSLNAFFNRKGKKLILKNSLLAYALCDIVGMHFR